MNFIIPSPADATLLSDINHTVSYYNQVLPLLTDFRVYEQRLVGHRFFVELISHSYELQDDYPVPRKSLVVDVVVVEPTEEAIKALVAGCGWLRNHTLIKFWQPLDSSEF